LNRFSITKEINICEINLKLIVMSCPWIRSGLYFVYKLRWCSRDELRWFSGFDKYEIVNVSEDNVTVKLTELRRDEEERVLYYLIDPVTRKIIKKAKETVTKPLFFGLWIEPTVRRGDKLRISDMLLVVSGREEIKTVVGRRMCKILEGERLEDGLIVLYQYHYDEVMNLLMRVTMKRRDKIAFQAELYDTNLEFSRNTEHYLVCPFCGAQMPIVAKYCGLCGAKLSK